MKIFLSERTSPDGLFLSTKKWSLNQISAMTLNPLSKNQLLSIDDYIKRFPIEKLRSLQSSSAVWLVVYHQYFLAVCIRFYRCCLLMLYTLLLSSLLTTNSAKVIKMFLFNNFGKFYTKTK